MFLTGRFPLILGAGALPTLLLSGAGVVPWAVVFGWLALCLVLAAVDVTAAAPGTALEAERTIPSRVLLGQRVDTVLRLRNTGERTLTGMVRDAWQPTAGAPMERAEVRIPAGDTWRITIPLLPRRRGELRSEFIMVRSVGPLRLAGRQSRIDSTGAIRVLPPFTARRHLPSRLARLRELDGNTSVNVRGQGTEFDSLREYVRGDDVRSIDWRATARSSSTMLRTWRPERDRHVIIVIDTGRTAAARVSDGVRMDASMETALLLAALASHAGDHTHLLMFDRVTRARVSRVEGPALLPALVDAMAPVQPQLIDTDWVAAMAQLRTLTSRPSLIVLLTAQDSPDSARGFLAALPVATRGTQVIVASVTDTQIDMPETPDAVDVYREAAAARAFTEAELVSAAITRAGAVALTDTPENLPPRVADQYLALKAAGLL